MSAGEQRPDARPHPTGDQAIEPGATVEVIGPPGFTYEVSDEQLRAYAARSPAERLRWLEEMREATWQMATPAARAAWASLRRGDR